MKWLKYMHITIWSIIAFCTILPLTTDSYGPAGGTQNKMKLYIINDITQNKTKQNIIKQVGVGLRAQRMQIIYGDSFCLYSIMALCHIHDLVYCREWTK